MGLRGNGTDFVCVVPTVEMFQVSLLLLAEICGLYIILLGENWCQERKNKMAVITELSSTRDNSEFSQDLQIEEKHIPRKVPSFCSIRYGIAFVAHLFNFMMTAQNSILTITIVAMVNSTGNQAQVNSSAEDLLVGLPDGPEEAPPSLPAKAPVYDWSPQTQGILFSSINYGILLTMALGGYLAGRMGARKVAGVCLLGSSVLTLCIPLAADLGLSFLIATRIVQGLAQGSGFGGHLALWQTWAPPHERSRLCSISLSGMILGIFASTLFGGIISQALGWPFAFYIFGGLGCVASLFWFVSVYNDPVSHPWIGISEKEYILSTLQQQVSLEEQHLPIKDMLTSLPLWSICLCSFSHQWLINTQVMYIPTYISHVYKVSIRDNGVLSSLPFIIAWIVGLLGGQLADFLLTKNVRFVTVRKIISFLGQLPSSVLIVTLPFLNSSYVTTITFLTLSCGLSPLSQSGVYINALDIAPRYSNFLLGATRGFAHISAVLVPIVNGFLLDQDPEIGWRNIFFLLFAISVLGLVFYLIFGEADVQDWAKERKVTRL